MFPMTLLNSDTSFEFLVSMNESSVTIIILYMTLNYYVAIDYYECKLKLIISLFIT